MPAPTERTMMGFWSDPKSRLDSRGTIGRTSGSRGSYLADWVAKARS